MNIKDIFIKPKNSKEKEVYASSIRRSLAVGIDIWIVLFVRAITMQIIGILFLNNMLQNYIKEFNDNFGTMEMKMVPSHLSFLLHHAIFYWMIFCYALLIFIGAFYHAYLNSSSWQATIGKRITGIMIAKSNMSRISIYRGFAHYFLSILPFAFIIYLVGYQLVNKLTMLQAVTTSNFNIFLSVIFVLWVQIHLFTRKKVTAYDLICDTVLINGKTNNKFPFKK